MEARREYGRELERRLEYMMLQDEIEKLRFILKDELAYNVELEQRLNKIENKSIEKCAPKENNHIHTVVYKSIDNNLDNRTLPLHLSGATYQNEYSRNIRPTTILARTKITEVQHIIKMSVDSRKAISWKDIKSVCKIGYSHKRTSKQHMRWSQLLPDAKIMNRKQKLDWKVRFLVVLFRLVDESFDNWKKRKKRLTDENSFILLKNLLD